MLPDLIQAFLAAALVVVIPGWFWAGVLLANGGRFERLIYSVAFSFALTPVVAFVPARVFGLGVTLPVAVSSPLLVFAAGALAYRRFGPVKATGDALAPRPARLPRLPALLPLTVAAGLMLGWAFGFAPGTTWYLLLTGVLVALAGVIYLIQGRRSPGAASTETSSVETEQAGEGRHWVLARRALVPVVFLLVMVRGYIGPVLQDWPFVQGVDHYSHAVMANLMQSRGEIFPYLIYPPGFHTATAMISSVSGLRPLEVFPVLAPALFLLPALALYVLAKRLWGWEYGAAAAFFVGVVANGPYIFYNDAMYPNLVTSEFLLVLTVAALVGLYASPSRRSGLAVALLGSATVFFHQVGGLYTALLLALIAVNLLPYLLLRERRRGVALLGSLATLGPLAVLYAWDTYDLFQVISGFLGMEGESGTGSAVSQAVGTQLPYSPQDLIGTVLTQPVAWLGLLGVFFLLTGLRSASGGAYSASRVTVLLWTLILLVGSTTPLAGFPQRFGQDLSVPLSLLAALASITLARTLSNALTGSPANPSSGSSDGRRVVMPAGAAAVLVCLAVGILAGQSAVRNLEPDGGPGVRLSFAKTLTITPEIAAAGEWLRRNNDGGYIMVSPQANQVPSRMMLAMGEYPGYQSFTYPQVVFPRDLPPRGTELLLDVLRVVNFPSTEQAQRIIRERDVRYVVLYKYMPDRQIVPYFQRFEESGDLYETVFENSDVLIVELRER